MIANENISFSPFSIPVGFLIELSETRGHDEVLEAFARWARVMIDCDRVAVLMAGKNGYFNRWSIDEGAMVFHDDAFHIATSTVGKFFQQGSSAIVEDLAAVGTHDTEFVAAMGLKVALYAPIVCAEQVMGMIVVTYLERKDDLTEDQLLMETLGRSLGTYMLLHDQVDQLSKQALTDPLTGLRNRRYFAAVASDALEQWRKASQRFAFFVIDLDHFKSVNDVHGHDVGDEVLQAVAGALKSMARKNDSVVRMGGEEFCFLLRDTPFEHVMDIAERVRQAVENLEIPLSDGVLKVTASIGVASIEQEYDSVEALLKAADVALYQAKEEGRNRVVQAAGPVEMS